MDTREYVHQLMNQREREQLLLSAMDASTPEA